MDLIGLPKGKVRASNCPSRNNSTFLAVDANGLGPGFILSREPGIVNIPGKSISGELDQMDAAILSECRLRLNTARGHPHQTDLRMDRVWPDKKQHDDRSVTSER